MSGSAAPGAGGTGAGGTGAGGTGAGGTGAGGTGAGGPAPFDLRIQVVEAAGLTAWLVEDHAIPVAALAWSLPGGAAIEPPGQAGAAQLAAGLLTEGAGPMPADAFADALRDRAISLAFGAGRDSFDGGLRALSPALAEAVQLANLAMTAPRLDTAEVDRARARAIAGARRALETPRGQAGRAFWARAFPGHPVGRPTEGTPETLAPLDGPALRAVLETQLRRDRLLVTAAGAITPAALAALLPALFGGLPAGAPPAAPVLPAFTPFGTAVLPQDAPQSAAVFGQPGLPVADPDWEAAGVALRILLGGGFASRLMQAVRERRGLAYGIGGGLDTLFGQGVIVGAVATENARIAETLAVVREEWARMADAGPTEAELADAVAYLTGSLPLGFSDTRRIADALLLLRRNGRPADWLAGRPARLAALTRAEVARVAGRLLDPAALAVAVVGRPEGL